MSDHEPSYYERRILLTNVGLAPQILTESLYALCLSRDPPFVPTEIHVVTTQKGRALIMKTLLDSKTGKLRQLADEFDLDVANALTPERIHVIASPDGAPLDDIGSEIDNTAAADLITEVVWRLTKRQDAAVHVSIAGGRKTMGFLLGYVLSLFGRDQDRLSHILVSPDFENHPDFFYPPRAPRTLTTRDGRTIDTADARLTLAQIPFVRLRNGLPNDLFEGRATLSEAVANAQKGFVAPSVTIDFERISLSCSGATVKLEPLPFALYAWLARRRMEGADGDGSTHWSVADPQDFLNEYRRVPTVTYFAVEEQEKLMMKKRQIPRETIEQAKRRANAVLQEALGRFSKPFEIQQRGPTPNPGHKPFIKIGLVLPPEAIKFGPIET